MFKISKLNPKDTVLDEIHTIQRKHFEERKGMTWQEEKNCIDKNVHNFEKQHNLKLKIIHPEEMAKL